MRDTAAIDSLPEGYSSADWNHSRYLYRSYGMDTGTTTCHRCGYRKRHELDWSREAFYQVEYRRAHLWAFHRESAVQLRAFIASPDRNPKKYKWGSLMLHVPTHFLHSSARPTILKRLDRLLAP